MDGMLLALLVQNILQGIVALVWVAGVRRLSGPSPSREKARLLALGLTFPVLFGALGLLGADLPRPFVLLRADRWATALAEAAPPVVAAFWVLVGGTAALFFVQELLPTLVARRAASEVILPPTDRLVSALDRVVESAQQNGVLKLRYPMPRMQLLDASRPSAALVGVARPRIAVSRGMLERLDDHQLEGVVAHELAHLCLGGNARMLALWLLRALQSASPAALVLFRELVEAREAACDALAVEMTGRPAALASALLRVGPGELSLPPDAGRLEIARTELRYRAEVSATRLRVRALLDEAPHAPAPDLSLCAMPLLGLLVWAVT